MRCSWMYRSLLAVVVAFLVFGCSSGDSDDTGTLSLSLTDAPVDDAANVMIAFTSVELQQDSGDRLTFDFDPPQQIDLLALRSGRSEILLEEELPPGLYNWIRLQISTEATDSYIELLDNSRHSLRIPSGDERGLQLNRSFEVPEDGEVDFTLDFDLRKSVRAPQGSSGDYILRPTVRMVATTDVGHIAGTVSESLLNDNSCINGDTVYVFEGAGVIPDDIDDQDLEPVTTAMVELDDATGLYTYRAAFLPAGDYTVAFTCQAGDDDPATNDTIVFLDTVDVTVTAGEETTHDF